MRRRQGGQAGIEVLAMFPVLFLIGLLAWQLVAVLGAGLRAQEQVRADAIRTVASAAGRTVVVSREVEVPQVLPGLGGLIVRARVGVRTP